MGNSASDILSSVSGIGSAIGGLALGAYNSHQAKELQKRQNEFNLKMWNLNNEYNTPLAQQQRLHAAGINPNFDSGQLVTSGTSDSPVTQNSLPNVDYTSGFQPVSNLVNSAFQTASVREDTKSKMSFNQFADAYYKGQVELQNVEIEFKGSSIRLNKKQLKLLDKTMQEVDARCKDLAANVQLTFAKIAESWTQQGVNEAQQKFIKANTKNIEADTNQKETLTPLMAQDYVAKIAKQYSDVQLNGSQIELNKASTALAKAQTEKAKAEALVQIIYAQNYDALLKQQIKSAKASEALTYAQVYDTLQHGKQLAALTAYQLMVNDNTPIELTWKNVTYRVNVALMRENISNLIKQGKVSDAQARYITLMGDYQQVTNNMQEAQSVIDNFSSILGSLGKYVVPGKLPDSPSSYHPQTVSQGSNWFTSY